MALVELAPTAATVAPARPKKPKLPGLGFKLDLAVSTAAAEVDVSAVNQQQAQHLIVDLEAGTMDSPFISTTAQFPTSGPAAIHKGLPRPPSIQSLSYAAAASRGPAAADVPSQATTAEGVAPPAAPSGKFFRVDDSNLFVFAGSSAVPAETNKQLSADAASFTEMAPTGGSIPFEALQIREKLGSGQQGTVFAVSHGGRNFALKKISVSEALDRSQADIERQARKNGIVRELQMVAARDKRNKHVVALYNAYFRSDADGEGQQLYILMERMSISVGDVRHVAARVPFPVVLSLTQRVFGNTVRGGSVDFRDAGTPCTASAASPSFGPGCRATPLPEIVLSLVAHDALSGLHHLHARLRMVHTDLKPDNLMFSEDLETVKVADFGCSQQLRPGTNDVLVTNLVLGTKLYMSPERAHAAYSGNGGTFNEKSDIWALGMVLLELAAGIHPCDAFREEFWEFSARLTWENLAKPDTCSESFVDFLHLCFAVDPEHRASAEMLLQHDFITRHRNTPRKKLAMFVKQLRTESATYGQRALHKQLSELAKAQASDRPDGPSIQRRNVTAWRGFRKEIIGDTPNLSDTNRFPSLGSCGV
jgi:serine/threonine protein kinase